MAFENLEARLRLDASQFKRQAESAGDSMSGLADRAGAVGKRMQSTGRTLALGVTLPLVGVGAASVKAASDVEEMQSKMSVVFGDLEGDIRAWSETQAEATNRSKFQFQEMATALQDTFVPMGFARDEAAAMSKEMSSLAVDLASFNNMETTEALDRLRGGIVGNHENLREFGVIINQTNLGEKLEEMFGKGVQEATEQEKMLARLQIVTEGTADAQGDAARTADSFANQMRGMMATLRETAVVFGRELMPMARDLVGAVRGLGTWFGNLDARSRRIVVVVAAIAAAAGPLLFLFGTLLAMLPAMAAGFGLVSAAASPLLIPILAIAAAVAALAAVWMTDFMGIRTTVTKAVKTIMSNLQPLIDMLGPEFQATIDHWKNVIRDGLAIVEGWWAKHGEQVMAVLGPLFENIRILVEGTLDALITLVRVALAVLRGDWEGAFDIMANYLDRQLDRFEQLGRNLIEAVANGVRIAGNAVKDSVEDALDEARDYLPFSDAKKGPLSDLTASGMAVPETFAGGIDAGAEAVPRAASGMAARAQPSDGGGASAQAIQQALSGMALVVQTGDETLDQILDGKARLVVRRTLRQEKRKSENRGVRG